MHTLLLPLIGFPLAIGFFYLYKDLRKVKNWNIEPDPLAQPRTDALEALAYGVPPIDGTTVEALGAEIEASVEAVEAIEASVEAGVEAASEGIGDLLESVGRFLHH
jgi:hypothetical protein